MSVFLYYVFLSPLPQPLLFFAFYIYFIVAVVNSVWSIKIHRKFLTKWPWYSCKFEICDIYMCSIYCIFAANHSLYDVIALFAFHSVRFCFFRTSRLLSPHAHLYIRILDDKIVYFKLILLHFHHSHWWQLVLLNNNFVNLRIQSTTSQTNIQYIDTQKFEHSFMWKKHNYLSNSKQSKI